MADQGKWFKLWESALDDQDLENLNIHEWFCWVRFGTYLKKHGREGKIRLRFPATALTNLLRLPSLNDVIKMLKRFPNYVVEEGLNETVNVTDANVTYHVKCRHWLKYQGDFSTERVRRFRKTRESETANVTVQEETRGEETKSPSPKGSSSRGSGRFAPPDAPATRPSVSRGGHERPENGHGASTGPAQRMPAMPAEEPSNLVAWEMLERRLTYEERVQSKLREKYYRDRKGKAKVSNGGEDEVF